MPVTQTRHVANGVATGGGGWVKVAGNGTDSMPSGAGFTVDMKFQNRGSGAALLVAFTTSNTAPSTDADAGVFTFPAADFPANGLKSWFETMKAGGCVYIKSASNVAWRTVAITEPYEVA